MTLTRPSLPYSRRLDENHPLAQSHQSGLLGEGIVTSQLPVIPSQDETHEEEEEVPSSAVGETVAAVVDGDRDSADGGAGNGGESHGGSFDEAGAGGAGGTRRVAVSVHDERAALLPSYSLKSTGDFVETLPGGSGGGGGRQDATRTSGTVTKSTSGDTQASLGVASSVSGGADGTAALLCASTSSLTSIAGTATAAAFRQPPPPRHRRFAAGCIDERDLSTPYNHYRCLSPNEHHHGTYPYVRRRPGCGRLIILTTTIKSLRSIANYFS